ncbi:MAG: outer membrane lipoprotein carrier protein [Lentisphaeria bacterium]|jgi:outer membrane lipoprotein carrier protein
MINVLINKFGSVIAISLIGLLFGYSGSVFAGTVDNDAIENKAIDTKAIDKAPRFTELLTAINTLSGEFTQVIRDPDGAEIQTTSGSFFLKRPGYFYWHISPPYEQLVVGTPNSLRIYDPDLEQLTVHSNDSLTGSPALLLSGDTAAIDAQYAIVATNTENMQRYTLRQHSDDQGSFESLTFVFVLASGNRVLSEMNFVDKLGQSTHITLAKVKINPPINDVQFDFEPPSGTDIILEG